MQTLAQIWRASSMQRLPLSISVKLIDELTPATVQIVEDGLPLCLCPPIRADARIVDEFALVRRLSALVLDLL
jgi:hypothetical protein